MIVKISSWISRHLNLSLLALLILVVTMTYFFEERYNINQEASLKQKLSLIDGESLGKITAIEGLKFGVEKRGSIFYDKENNLKLSERRIDEFFEILSGLKIKTLIEASEVAKVGKVFYIPDPSKKMTFMFEKGAITFILGKKLEYDQSFYMEVIQNSEDQKDQKSQIAIINDESADPGIYQNDDDYKKSDAKYRRLEMLFLLTNKYFYDALVFKDMGYLQDQINFKSIEISTFRNKKYSLDFKSSATIPTIPKGFKYFEENWISFHRVLTGLEGKNLYFPAEPALLKEPLSRFEVIDRDNRSYTLDVYKRYGEENGYFLKSSLDNVVYQLRPEEAKYFFVNVQDFWEKRLGPKNKAYNLKIEFWSGQSIVVEVTDKDLFKVKGVQQGLNNTKLRPVEFKKLIDFFKAEGDHISEMTEKPTEILKKNILKVSFENKTLNVILDENEAIIVDVDLRIKLHHYVGATLPFSIKHEDYLAR